MKTECPECGQSVEADDQYAGAKVPCPTCQHEFTLPGPNGPPPLPPPTSLATPPPPVIVSRAITPQSAGNRHSYVRTIQIAIVCATVLGGLWIWKGSGHVVTITTADGTKIQVNVGAVESVLKKDATTGTGATSVAEVVTRMRAIYTSDCPNDFRAAYLAHIQAWEAMAEVEQQASAFKSDREGAGDFVEGFVRGFLGDPLGKANEIRDAQTQLQRNYQAAREQVRQSFNQVQQIAVAYGAELPKK
jgi:hypothetical protein